MQHGQNTPWFRVKRYGYGAGLPIRWEGWLLLALFVAVPIIGGIVWGELAAVGLALALTPPLLYLARKHSDAAWRWRSGE